MTTAFAVLGFAAFGLFLGACGDGSDSSSTATEESSTGDGSGQDAGGGDQEYPEIVGAEATETDEGTYDFDVTISSPYDTPERYADGWQVLGPDGEVLGEMELGHDHASEQPFTRTQFDVEIPADVTEVQIEGHDLENGYGGKRFTVQL